MRKEQSSGPVSQQEADAVCLSPQAEDGQDISEKPVENRFFGERFQGLRQCLHLRPGELLGRSRGGLTIARDRYKMKTLRGGIRVPTSTSLLPGERAPSATDGAAGRSPSVFGGATSAKV